jgi:hypothetical protein
MSTRGTPKKWPTAVLRSIRIKWQLPSWCLLPSWCFLPIWCFLRIVPYLLRMWVHAGTLCSIGYDYLEHSFMLHADFFHVPITCEESRQLRSWCFLHIVLDKNVSLCRYVMQVMWGFAHTSLFGCMKIIKKWPVPCMVISLFLHIDRNFGTKVPNKLDFLSDLSCFGDRNPPSTSYHVNEVWCRGMEIMSL